VGENSVNDILAGTNGDDILSGLSGDDTITGGSGIDTITGGSGADTMTGGDGNDRFVFANLDSNITLPALTTNPLVGLDIITDFTKDTNTTNGDILDFVGTAVKASTDPAENGDDVGTISAHSVSSSGEVKFYSTYTSSGGGSVSGLINLSSQDSINKAADYLIKNDIGSAGATVFFKTETDTYVYSQGTNSLGNTGGYSFVKLDGVQALGLDNGITSIENYINIA
jgi:hypothetical protein